MKNGYKILQKKVKKESNKASSMREFLKKAQKGSKIFRKIIMGKCNLGVTKLVQYKTYCKLTGNEDIPEIGSKKYSILRLEQNRGEQSVQ